MKYFVTYCTSDQDVDANPLWHSGILLSRWKEGDEKAEVLHNWGFYGVPSTAKKDSWLIKMKMGLGLNIDFTGNHGMLKQEDIRFYDRGYGLHGVSFELTPDQFERLETHCSTMLLEQEAAIREVVDSQGIRGKPEGKERLYAHEEFSSLIYSLEQIKAEQQGRESRLKPFEVRLSLGFWGPGFEQSKNCKSQAVSLLAVVLSQDQIDRLTENGKHPTIPRFSGKMEDIYLHSSGPLHQHTKASGGVVYYRDTKDADVKLYWTLPPQEMNVLSKETQELFQIDENYCQRVKPLVKQLQSIEWLFRNAEVPEKLQPYKVLLIQQLIDCYQNFSNMRAKPEANTVSPWHAWALSLFSLPKDSEEIRLQKQIDHATTFLNALYMAIVDNWRIDDQYPPDDPNSLNFLDLESEANAFTNPLESLAAYLSLKDKESLCKILGRSVCESESLLVL